MYILDQSEQKELLERCDLVDENWKEWSKEYKEKESDQHWIQFYPYSGMQGGGPVYLKKKEENCDTLDWVDRHLSSERKEDWIGLTTEYSPTIQEAEELLSFLKERKEKYSKEALLTFSEKLRINRGTLIGKRIDEINEEVEVIERIHQQLRKL